MLGAMDFGAGTTTDEVLDGVDLSSTTALVTGASSGLGQETARALAAHGASLVLGVRDVAKGEAAAEPVRAAVAAAGAGGTVEVRAVDLTSLRSIRAFGDSMSADHASLDLLVANAGVMATPQATTEDGFELQLGTNHLGHFVLVNRLAPLLLAGGPSRVVVLSSSGHRFADVDLDDPGFERTEYDPWIAYGRSKTANALFALELDRRLRAQGVRAASVHPGFVHTELGRHLTDETITSLLASAGAGGLPTPKSVEAGAATSVWAGVVADADEVGGRFCEDCHVAEPAGEPGRPGGVHPWAQEPTTARALWDLSERLVGETFPAPAGP
ncbi:MAG: SDR family NAD(P)-dependent oxidoreductase [Acidimicrobiia bacterium]|nr:SDR family NAD(P)-dependent oxidoreductase [Acidimicrobiia bacterium]